MKTMFPMLVLALLVVSCASRPLVYDEMDDAEKEAESKLQANLESTAEGIAVLAFKFVDEDKRADLAKKVSDPLVLIQGLLESGDSDAIVKDLIDRTLGELKLLGADIGEVAKDAFDLFSGWIAIPNLNDHLPEVIKDRLLAFVKGAVAGLSEYVPS